MGKDISQRKRLAAIFVSFAILSVGTFSLYESMAIDYYSVLNTIEKIIPASIIMGGLGWVMGMILDKPQPKNNKTNNYNDAFLNNIKNEISNEIDATEEGSSQES